MMLLLMLAIGADVGIAYATDHSLTPLHTLAQLPSKRFVELVTRQKYEAALALADSLTIALPKEPAGWFFRETVLNNRAIDYEDNSDLPAMNVATDSVEAICHNRMAAGDSSAELFYYLGTSEGFRMIHAIRAKEYLKALKLGTHAADQLERAVRLDSTCYDAYTGLGNYYYFKSRYSGILRISGLVSDRRAEGMNYLRLAADHGILTSLAARSSIAWISLNRHEPDTAVVIASNLSSLYPESRAFRWCLGHAYMDLERWKEAIDVYTEILQSVRTCKPNNHFNEIGCLHSIAKASAGLGLWKQVVETADEALHIPISDEIAERKEKDLDHLEDLRRQGIKELEKSSAK